MSTIPATPSRPFGAVGTAMITPFTPDGESLDREAAVRVAQHLVEHGNDLLVLGGTTGESPTTTDEEKIDLVRLVSEAVGDRARIVAGVGTNDTRHSIELAQRHAELGIDGLLLVTPYYSKPSQEGILAHTRAIADATELPIMLYDIPGRSGVPLALDTLLRLGEHERIVAVKDAKADLHQATEVMSRTDLVYYSGEDALNLPWLALGAAGVVSVVGHAASDLERELIAAVDRGDLAHSRAVHGRLRPLVEAIMNRMPGVVAAKTALQLQGVLDHAAVRGPLIHATEEQTRQLAEAIAAEPGIPALATTSGRTA